MKQISKKQAQRNQMLAKIKKELFDKNGGVCMLCKSQKGTDLMHILQKSLYPEYYTSPWNLIIGCRSCHDLFDNSSAFRRKTGLYKQIKIHDEHGAWRYFQMNSKENDL